MLDDGRTLHLWGNTWKVIGLPYDYTSGTVMELDFKSNSEGELQIIAVDTNASWPQVDYIPIYGTDVAAPVYETGQGWQHYAFTASDFVPVGTTYNYLVFVADDDAAPYQAHGWFRKVRIYEAGQTTQRVSHTYDPFDRLVKTEVDPDGTGGSDPVEQTFYLWEMGQIALQFDKTGSGKCGGERFVALILVGPGRRRAFGWHVCDWACVRPRWGKPLVLAQLALMATATRRQGSNLHILHTLFTIRA